MVNAIYRAENGQWYKRNGIGGSPITRFKAIAELGPDIRYLDSDDARNLLRPSMLDLVKERFATKAGKDMVDIEMMSESCYRFGVDPIPMISRILGGLCEVASEPLGTSEKSILVLKRFPDGSVDLKTVVVGTLDALAGRY